MPSTTKNNDLYEFFYQIQPFQNLFPSGKTEMAKRKEESEKMKKKNS